VKVLGAGRASEIIDLGDGRVLRRFKAGGNPEREALVMRHAAAHGFPVPEVHEVHDDALVLEFVDGPTMLAEVLQDFTRLDEHAALLARLHVQLHDLQVPPEFGQGRLLHMDFHPDNVLLSSRGPVVIDWAIARAGEPELDVAMTWVICATSGGEPGERFVRSFLPHFDEPAIRRALPAAAELRIADPNVTDEEREAVRSLLAK
jgi:aminoglycoside phosphotransferase (APT) family kinase protein